MKQGYDEGDEVRVKELKQCKSLNPFYNNELVF